jgi:hypothetical protein
MRQTRSIRTNKIYDIYVDFKNPTTEDKFKRTHLYKRITKFIKDNEFILYHEMFNNTFDPSYGDIYDPIDDPEFYTFSFLRKKHALAVSKEFGLKMIKHEMFDCWIYWPEPDDTINYDNPWLPPGMTYDDCMDIYGDIPGNRG